MPHTEAKASKAEAQYLEAAPGSERCGTCTMFRPPESCTAVEGFISPEAVCRRFYEPIAAARSPFARARE